eukprot:TRINITY_DN50291_c0_g1_i1.p1 TRINITY_DN50291_c0_g1~~TRINITY_DN50291_c0_g1_i1.p1  ORF type:complete len:236 (+),score=17.79 TRINITY_DN50291_c0_g1_i1:44-709(+)
MSCLGVRVCVRAWLVHAWLVSMFACMATLAYRVREIKKTKAACTGMSYIRYGVPERGLFYMKGYADAACDPNRKCVFFDRLHLDENVKDSNLCVLVPINATAYYLALQADTDQCLVKSEFDFDNDQYDRVLNKAITNSEWNPTFKSFNEEDCFIFEKDGHQLKTSSKMAEVQHGRRDEDFGPQPFYLRYVYADRRYLLQMSTLKSDGANFLFDKCMEASTQ